VKFSEDLKKEKLKVAGMEQDAENVEKYLE
jgi:hypothetical protein